MLHIYCRLARLASIMTNVLLQELMVSSSYHTMKQFRSFVQAEVSCNQQFILGIVSSVPITLTPVFIVKPASMGPRNERGPAAAWPPLVGWNCSVKLRVFFKGYKYRSVRWYFETLRSIYPLWCNFVRSGRPNHEPRMKSFQGPHSWLPTAALFGWFVAWLVRAS